MNYSDILSRAARLAWRHRVLWIFGFFAGIGQAGNFFRFDLGSTDRPPSAIGPAVEQGLPSPEMLLLIFVGLLVASIALIVVSAIARGALIASVKRIDRGESPRFRTGVSEGFKNFLSLIGIDFVIVFSVGFILAFLVAAFVIPIAMSFKAGNNVVAFVLIALGLLVFLVLVVPALLAVGVLITYAESYRVVEGTGLFSSLSRSFALLRSRFGQSAILFLISFGLSIGFGLLVGFTALVTIAPALLLLKKTIAGAILLALPGLAAALLASSIFQTFTSGFWTLAFLEMTGADKDGTTPMTDYVI